MKVIYKITYPNGKIYIGLVLQSHLKVVKPRKRTKPRAEARPARCASRSPLCTSADSGWPPSTRAQSARAVHARTSQYGRPTACLPRSSDDQSQGGLFAASVSARGEKVVPSGHR